MNDITSSPGPAVATPSSAPAPSSPAPDATPSTKTSEADLAVMAAPDGADFASEQMHEDETPGLDEHQRRINRHQRKNQAIQARDREIAELKAKYEPPRAENGEADAVGMPDEAGGDGEVEQAAQHEQQPISPEEHAAYEQQRVAHERNVGSMLERERQYAAQNPDYEETWKGTIGDVEIPPIHEEMLIRFPHLSRLKHEWAKSVEGLEALESFRRMPPIEAAQFLGEVKARIETEKIYRQYAQQYQQPQRRISQAPRPIAPLRGSGAGPPSQLGQINNLMKKWYGDRG